MPEWAKFERRLIQCIVEFITGSLFYVSLALR